MNKLVLLLLVAVFFSFCGKSQTSRIPVEHSDMKEIVLTNENTIYLQDWVRDVEIIPLETSDKALVGNISGIIVTDNHIIVYDIFQTKSVFIFGRDGKHRATINRRGRGPQEYVSLEHVAMLPDNKTIAINDNMGQKVLHFTLDGRFISSTPSRFRFFTMEYLTENKLVCAAYGISETDPGLQEYENRTDLLYFTDNTFEITGSTLPKRYKEGRFQITPNLHKFEDQVYVHRPLGDTIYRATPDRLKAIYRIEMKKIDGESNLRSDITAEDFDLLSSQKNTFPGLFADSKNYFNVPVVSPDRKMKNYLYSKRSGKVYRVEQRKEGVFGAFSWPRVGIGDKFAEVKLAYQLIDIGGEEMRKQHPELANLTEESNPVIVLYGFKEGL